MHIYYSKYTLSYTITGTLQCEKHLSPQKISVIESTRWNAQVPETLNLYIGQLDKRVSKTALSSSHLMNTTKWAVQEVKKLPRSTLEDKDGQMQVHITVIFLHFYQSSHLSQ